MTRAKIGFYLLAIFYILAGLNHFRDPAFYLPLIPNWLPDPTEVNLLSGVAEIALGIGLLYHKTRYLSAVLIVAMLLAFIPSHIWFIQIGSCAQDPVLQQTGLCVPPWVAWVRLLLIHPLLVWWAAAYRNYHFA